jgi:microsomal dipeptidase-like Zn-dependent dipeptidase
MHLDAERDGVLPGGKSHSRTLEAIRGLRKGARSFGEWLRAFILDLASRIGNYRRWDAGPAVTVDKLIKGRVGAALSVLYQPFCEMDLGHFGAAPEATYFGQLLVQLNRVEDEVRQKHKTRAIVAHNPRELSQAIEGKMLAIVHAVEGGFHVGAEPLTVARNVHTLAQYGVAYITAAHLFWRQVASNVPALPFLPDMWYRRLFPEPDMGLTDIGAALIDAMANERILVDVTHMTELAMCDTFDRLPPDVPVIASHMACRFGGYAYNLTDRVVRKIVRRGGVLGVILCDHFCNEGRARTKRLEQSVDAVCRQIDHIYAVAGSHDHAAIGTDLDGFIKPTLAGLDDASQLYLLEDALVSRYGAVTAEKICSGNALRLLRSYWRGGKGPSHVMPTPKGSARTPYRPHKRKAP